MDPSLSASSVRGGPVGGTPTGATGTVALLISKAWSRFKPWLVSTTVLVILAGVFVARTGFAKITLNTIDPVGIVADKGRQVTVTEPVAVTVGERTELRVTVTQRSTGAVAEGVIFFAGTGQTNQWEVTVAAEGRAAFQAGPATVVGLARSSVNGHATDAHQWLVNVTLLRE